MAKILVGGSGGFIGGHLVKRLMQDGHQLVCADMKPFELWYQIFDENENHQLDLKEKQNTDLVTQNVDYVFNMACGMDL